MLTPWWISDNGETTLTLYQGDALVVLQQMPAESVQCVVTSPPYWGLRDYGAEGQMGLEKTPEEYVAKMVEVFREVRRVLRKDGTCWLNLGDAYAGSWGAQGRDGQMADRSVVSARQIENHPQFGTRTGARTTDAGYKPKDLLGMPWRVAFALQADGWWLRSDIIWSKPNPMPESVTDRPTKAHEYVFLLTKAATYYYDANAIREDGAGRLDLGRMKRPEARLGEGGKWADDNGFKEELGRNRRTVWEIATEAFPEAHFATFPEKLVEPCILAGTSEKGCCPECGAPWARRTVPQEEHGARRQSYRTVRYNPESVAFYLRERREFQGLTVREMDEALGTVTLYSWYEGRPAGTQLPTAQHYRTLKSLLQLDDRFDALLENPATGERDGWEEQDKTLTVGLRGAGDHIPTAPITLGWVPTCAHSLNPQPCTVLDPFAGSGTTLLVAQRLGRHGVGIELKPDYCTMAVKRLDGEHKQMRLGVYR